MKGKKILIIMLVLVIILILAGGVAYAYFATDLLKSNEQLFYKYMAKVTDNIESLESNEAKQYYERLQTTPYENEGKLSVEVDLPKELGINTDNVNNVNVTFSGSVDKANGINEQKMNLNYSKDVSLPITYRGVDGKYGILPETITTKFIAIDMNRLDDLLKNLGASSGEISEIMSSIDELQSTDVTANMENINDVLVKYKDIITNNIDKTNFSKQNGEIVLTLTQTQVVNIVSTILTELKTESFMTDSLNDIIDNLLKNLEKASADENTIGLQLIVNNDGTLKIGDGSGAFITLQTSAGNLKTIYADDSISFDFTIQKKQTEQSIIYDLNANISEVDENTTIAAYVTSNLSNYATQNAQETYEFGFSGETDELKLAYDYTLDSDKTFKDSVNVEKLNTENALLLNDLDVNTMTQLYALLAGQFEVVTEGQMESLGITSEQNPLLYATPIGLYILVSDYVPYDYDISGETGYDYDNDFEDESNYGVNTNTDDNENLTTNSDTNTNTNNDNNSITGDNSNSLYMNVTLD